MKKGQKNENERDNFANRLKIVAKKAGGLSRLAENAGVSLSALSRYSAGTLPNLATAAAIAKAGDVSLDWLGTGRGMPEAESPEDSSIPFFDQRASAGPGLLALNHNPAAQTIFIPLAQIRRQTGIGPSNLCALLAEGDSMEPTFKSGDLLVLDRNSVQPREGVFVVLRGDDVLVKRIQPRGPQLLRIISDNERYGAEDVMMDDEASPVRLFGRVIWIGQPI